MKKVSVYNSEAKKIKDVELNPEIFGIEVKESVVHQVAVAQMANSRDAIAHTKTRGEVRGGGKKPWRQKGTGRARHGSSRSPLWIGGGVTFGPRSDRNFSQKVNKKMKIKALFMCLSDKVAESNLFLLDKMSLSEGKTRELVKVINQFKNILSLEQKNKKTKKQKNTDDKIEKAEKKEMKKDKKFDIKNFKTSLLIVLEKSDRKIFNAGRNVEGLKIITVNSLNVLDILKYKNIIMVENGLKEIEKMFLKK